MSFLGGLFSGGMGAGFQAERSASPEQAQQLYNQQQENLMQQRMFTQALANQGPGAIAAQGELLKQMQAQAAGTGPSVAQRQLAQTTGQNVAQQAALLAGQRGASANVGLAGRQIGQAGTQAQQQAAGQSATLRAQEQLANQQALAGLTGQQIGQISGAQQLGIQGTQGAQENILNAIYRQNAVNAGIAAGNQQFQSGLVGGLIGGGASALKGAFAEGGEVGADDQDEEKDDFFSSFSKSMAAPKTPQTQNYMAGQQAGQGAGQMLGKTLSGLFGKSPSGQTTGGYAGANLGVKTQMPQMINPMATSQAIGGYKLPFEKGGKVPAMVSPGERYLPPEEVEKIKKGQKEPVKAGKMIPGQAKVKGDSLKNDTVSATLEEGGIVIPRSVMQSENPEEKARQFVAAVLAKQSLKRK
jgi:hypothetical protein